ncbi:uncharacterized protein EAF02_004157 [Botrytis sinoallii]|uniref:uncharacterized protein n=1 Tax=Botrytis sinoallii TaxID=1463999 RepID=UPI0018FF5BCD|nr:uncharacterized protein EAF02_004157 [Botrytis sinoallii]KAF7885648.1 hypothetical protein EAF02_004157 [Botrytis sinoallii]
MMEPQEDDSNMLGAEEENKATAGVREEGGGIVPGARYSNVQFSKNMTSEELLESLKYLIGPGAEDEKKRRVIKWSQTEKGRRKSAEGQARNKEKKIEKIKKFQMRGEIEIARDAQRAERRAIAEVKLRWDAEHPEEAAKREMGLSTATDRNMMKSDAARGVAEEAVEADALKAEEMADDDSDVNMMKGLEYAGNSTFTLSIRRK